MGLVQDITTLMRKGPELASQVNSIKLNTKSIAKGAKDSTFQFPCLIVDSAPIDMANTVARTLDQVYATFTQTWLSMNSMFDITIDPTPLSYLRKLHQNLKLEGVEDLEVNNEDIDEYMEKVYDGSYKLYMNSDKTYGVLFNMADSGTKSMYESHKDMLHEYMSEFDLQPIDVMEANSVEMLSSAARRASDKFDNVNKAIFGDDEAPAPTLNNEYDFANAVLSGQAKNARREEREANLKASDKGRAPQLTQSDIKKSNDLMPYGIQVRLLAVNDKKEFVQYVDFIVGVKTILHPVTSEDMIDNIARALQNKSLMFKLLRWTTGEISLVKDIILNLNDMKSDAINKQNGRSPFFSTLKRLKNKKIGMSNLTVPHAVIPNATMVITTYEADQLLNRFGLNVRDEKVALKLLSSLFLMSFIIMDEGTNTISILYDGDNSYQVYSLETLERDNNLNSNKLGREIGRMIAR